MYKYDIMPTQTENIYSYWLEKYPDLPLNKPNNVYKILQNTKKSNSDKNISLSTIRIILSACMWKIRQTNKKLKSLERYSELINLASFKLNIKERDNKSHVGVIPKWNDILSKRDSLRDTIHLKEHLLLSLYTYIPPRRIKDYLLLKFVNNIGDITDSTSNYYVSNENKFYFNSYKTVKKFKQQIKDCPNELHDIIFNYVKNIGVNNGDLLLGIHDYHQINYMLKKLVGCSVNNIRHSFVNGVYCNYNLPTSEHMEKLANDMSHDLTTHLRYRKF